MLAYNLTPYTGARRSEHRRVDVGITSVQRRPFMVTLIAAPVGLVFAGLLSLLIAALASIVGWRLDLTGLVIVVPVFTVIVALWMFETRQRRGMQLHRYKAMLNSRAARGGSSTKGVRMTGVMLVNGQIPDTPAFILHTPLTVPGRTAEAAQPSPTSTPETPVVAKGARRFRRPKRDWNSI